MNKQVRLRLTDKNVCLCVYVCTLQQAISAGRCLKCNATFSEFCDKLKQSVKLVWSCENIVTFNEIFK